MFVSRTAAKASDLWTMAGVLLILILMVEGTSRLAVWAMGLDKTPMGFRTHSEGFLGKVDPGEYMLELLDASDVRWEPFSYWRGAPFRGKYVNIQESGLRITTNNRRGFGAGGKRVWMFGGSPMWGFGARDGFTIPSQVSYHLMNQVKIPAAVANFGQIGYVSAQSLIELEKELRAGRVPDAVVFLDGSNEIISSMIHGKPGFTPNEANRIREFNLLNESRAGALWAETAVSVLDHSAAYRLIKSRKSAVAAKKQNDSKDKDWDGMAQAYRFNISAVEALAKRYKFRALFYWQPFVFDKKKWTNYEKLAAEYSAYLKPAALEARASLARIDFKKEGLRFRDISSMFDESEEPVFLDWCHFSEAGNRAIGRLIAEDIAKALAEK